MARLREQDGRLIFQVRLTPKGGRDALECWATGPEGREHLKARVAALPEDGKANAALVVLLAKSLGIAKSSVSIVAGATARLKTIAIHSTAPAARLETWGEKS
jgi:uncharacterized protein YggU (UPF0235/DUF167 family)